MHHYSFFVQIYMREAKLANEVRNCTERVCSKSPSSSTAMIHCTGESRLFCQDTNIDITTRYRVVVIL